MKDIDQLAPHVRFVPEADIAPTESELTRSEISLLNIFSAFAGSTRATWTIEHDGTGRTELPFVLDKAKGYATRSWNTVLAEPHRIRRAGICILLSIAIAGTGAVIMIIMKATALNLRMTLHSSLGLGVTTIAVGVCSLKPQWDRWRRRS
jgi:hypothetical protein